MDKIIRCITSDGAVMASAIDASDIVFTAKKLHNLSRSATAALGRLLCATSIMGNMLKQKNAIINLRVLGDGEMERFARMIADDLGINEETCKKRIQRASARFKKAYNEEIGRLE